MPAKRSLNAYCQKLSTIISERFKNNPKMHFMPTNSEIFVDGDIEFVLKNLKSLQNKPLLKQQDFDKDLKKSDDPFCPPYEQQLVITENLTKDHAMVCNKYPISNDHVLVITKEYVHQKTPLTYNDVEACLIAMKAVNNGFIFYNCGKLSGASQPHKHMQCFPESNFSSNSDKLPVSAVIEKYVSENDITGPFMIPSYDFLHEIRYFQTSIKELLGDEKLEEATRDVFVSIYVNIHHRTLIKLCIRVWSLVKRNHIMYS